MNKEEKATEIFHHWTKVVPLEEGDFHLKLAKRYAIKSIDDQINFIEQEMVNIDYLIREVYIEELKEIKKELQAINY